jgi:hypothetical protein
VTLDDLADHGVLSHEHLTGSAELDAETSRLSKRLESLKNAITYRICCIWDEPTLSAPTIKILLYSFKKPINFSKYLAFH